MFGRFQKGKPALVCGGCPTVRSEVCFQRLLKESVQVKNVITLMDAWTFRKVFFEPAPELVNLMD